MIVIPYPLKTTGTGKATRLFWLGNLAVVHVTEYIPAHTKDRLSHEQYRVLAFDRTTGKKKTVHTSWNIKGVEFVLTKPQNQIALLDLSSYTLREIRPEWLNTPRWNLPIFHSEIHNSHDHDASPQANTDTVQTTIQNNTQEHDTVTINNRTLDLGETFLKATATHPDNTTVAVAGNTCLYLIDVD